MLQIAAVPNERTVLDESVPFSRSILWRLQRRYFEQSGVDAWRRGVVPHYVTSNPFIADGYARVIAGFLRDHAGEAPVDIVELGAGSGRFAFHLLRRLRELDERGALAAPFRYVMTDFTDGPIAFWREHPALAPFVERGLLDFARFDVERDRALTLLGSGRRIDAAAPARPLVAVANYFFDGIPQDAFQVRGGRLYECLATAAAREAAPDLDDPSLLGRVELTWSTRALAGAPYGDRELDAILEHYRGRLADTVVRLPVAALRCCRLLDELAGGRLLLLSADRGWAHEASLLGQGEPQPTVHGSFSLPVDYHAIGELFRRRGGAAMHAAHRASSLVVAAFLSDGAACPATRAAFADALARFTPDDFYALKKAYQAAHHQQGLPELLAFLRLARGDARVLAQSIERLVALAPGASDEERHDLCALVEDTWDNYFHLGEEADLAFDLGVLLAELGQPRRAIAFFYRSLELYGDDAHTFFNLAVCHRALGESTAAAGWVGRALAADPEHAGARAMRIDLDAAGGGRP